MQRNRRFIKLCVLPLTIILFACSTKPDPLCNRHNSEKSSPKCFLPPPPQTQKTLNMPKPLPETITASSASSTPKSEKRSANLKALHTAPSIPLTVREKNLSPSVISQNLRGVERKRTQKLISDQVTARDKTTNSPKAFTVQLGVYQQESHRVQAINKLGEKYSPLLFPVKNKLYGLASGIFDNRTAAEKHEKLLKAMGFNDAYVRSSTRFSSKK